MSREHVTGSRGPQEEPSFAASPSHLSGYCSISLKNAAGLVGATMTGLAAPPGTSVQLPIQVLLDGIDLNGSPTGHVRVTKMRTTIRGPYQPALFVHPTQLDEIERGMN